MSLEAKTEDGCAGYTPVLKKLMSQRTIFNERLGLVTEESEEQFGTDQSSFDISNSFQKVNMDEEIVEEFSSVSNSDDEACDSDTSNLGTASIILYHPVAEDECEAITSKLKTRKDIFRGQL